MIKEYNILMIKLFPLAAEIDAPERRTIYSNNAVPDVNGDILNCNGVLKF